MKKSKKNEWEKYISTGIFGFDNLFKNGIPKGSSILVAGGAGSGKTNFCLQILAHHASQGKNRLIFRLPESIYSLGFQPKFFIYCVNLSGDSLKSMK